MLKNGAETRGDQADALTDYLKIDGVFIRIIRKNIEIRIVDPPIVRIALGMDQKTIATYSEDEEAFHIFRDRGVDYGQGYYISLPESGAQGLPPLRLPAPAITH
jgi:EAL domain-containing protein (putative c-di-GMP-specific phosphodiesterase class I)